MNGLSESITPVGAGDRLALLLAPILLIILIVLFSGLTGQDQGAISETAWILLTSAPLAALWLLAAIGFGYPLRTLLAKGAHEGLCIQIALGVAALMTLDAALGALGVLQNFWIAWAVIAVGFISVAVQIAHALRNQFQMARPHWLIWTCLPAVGVLLVASCSAPGWLWSSEFGGYDALSYHLQLPKEWQHLGRFQGLEHNVYSFLPSYVEAAFYHLFILNWGGIETAYACQFLHAGLALLSAVLVYQCAARFGGTLAGTIAFVLFMATPWVIVVGSLAYNEMAVVLMLAAGLLAIADEGLAPSRRAALIGILAGAACGAKLTAVGMVAAPLCALLLFTAKRRNLAIATAVTLLSATIVLSPYFIRNVLQTGNPVFPFATSLFGSAHWTQEQVETWSRGHYSDQPFPGRFLTLWNEFIRFGLGSNPNSAEPWKPQWGLLPWLFVASVCAGATSKAHRKWLILLSSIVAIQICFWLVFTHLKSRFLLPTVVPMSIASGIVMSRLVQPPSVLRKIVAAAALLVLEGFVIFIFARERNGAPAAAIGSARLFTGELLSAKDRETIGSTTLPAVAINWLLPEGSKTLLLGDAKPFYHRTDRVAYQTTWDRGPFSQSMRNHPDDPSAWAKELKQHGFDYVLIDSSMLQRWERAHWNDPLLTADRINTFLQRHATLQFAYPNDISLYKINSE
jgi:hypothetical protein